jgi:hypothetical protein
LKLDLNKKFPFAVANGNFYIQRIREIKTDNSQTFKLYLLNSTLIYFLFQNQQQTELNQYRLRGASIIRKSQTTVLS